MLQLIAYVFLVHWPVHERWHKILFQLRVKDELYWSNMYKSLNMPRHFYFRSSESNISGIEEAVSEVKCEKWQREKHDFPFMRIFVHFFR
jgi:hypothetical protein